MWHDQPTAANRHYLSLNTKQCVPTLMNVDAEFGLPRKPRPLRRGGISLVSQATVSLISNNGHKEFKEFNCPEPVGNRVRKKGGGGKKVSAKRAWFDQGNRSARRSDSKG